MYYFRLNRNICRILPTFLANVPKNIGSASFWLNAYSQSGVSKMGDLCISSSPAESCEVLWFINPFLDPWIPWLLYGLQSFRSSWSQVPCLCAYYMGTRVNTKIAGKWGSPPKQGLNKVFNEDMTIFIHLKNAWLIEGWLHITPFAYAPKIMPKLSYWMGYANFEKCPGTCRDVYVALYFCDVLRHLLYFIPKFESCSGSILFLSDAMLNNHPLLNSRYYWLSHYSCWVYM